MNDAQGGLVMAGPFTILSSLPLNYPVPVGKNEEIKHRMIIEYPSFVGFFLPVFFS